MRNITIALILFVLTIAAGCSSSRLHIESVSKNYAIVVFESGAMITPIPKGTDVDMMR